MKATWSDAYEGQVSIKVLWGKKYLANGKDIKMIVIYKPVKMNNKLKAKDMDNYDSENELDHFNDEKLVIWEDSDLGWDKIHKERLSKTIFS